MPTIEEVDSDDDSAVGPRRNVVVEPSSVEEPGDDVSNIIPFEELENLFNDEIYLENLERCHLLFSELAAARSHTDRRRLLKEIDALDFRTVYSTFPIQRGATNSVSYQRRLPPVFSRRK